MFVAHAITWCYAIATPKNGQAKLPATQPGTPYSI